MSLLIATPTRDNRELAERLRALLPGIEIRVWPDIGDPDEVEFALAWNPPRGLFGQLPNLRAVSSLGAGVDGLIDDPELPADVPLGRLAGRRLAANMAAYLVGVVVERWKRLGAFDELQQRREWRQWAPEHPPSIGLLGLGEMGARAARVFLELEFPVLGFSRSGRGPAGVDVYRGRRGLNKIAARADFLINLLPLTPATRDILDARLFARMKPDATVINVGRGAHLVEADLIDALAAGRPAHAVLDVFRAEPLPENHPFWDHPQITITPHCSSITLSAEAAELAAESYRRVLAGQPPLGAVDRERGY